MLVQKSTAYEKGRGEKAMDNEMYFCMQVCTPFKPNKDYETGKMLEENVQEATRNRMIGYAEYYQVLGSIILMAEKFANDHNGKIISVDNYSADDWCEYGRGEINIEIDMSDPYFTLPTKEEKEKYEQLWNDRFDLWFLYMGTDEEVQDEHDYEESERETEQFREYYGIHSHDEPWPYCPDDIELI